MSTPQEVLVAVRHPDHPISETRAAVCKVQPDEIAEVGESLAALAQDESEELRPRVQAVHALGTLALLRPVTSSSDKNVVGVTR